MWLEKYGPPTRTDYRVTVENLSSKVSHQMLQFFWEKVNTIVPGKLAGLEGLHEDSGRGDFFENTPKKIPTLSNNSFSNNQISGTQFSYQLKVTFADAHKSRRNEGTVEFASRRDMEVGHFVCMIVTMTQIPIFKYFDSSY